jgi:hypothetical protein
MILYGNVGLNHLLWLNIIMVGVSLYLAFYRTPVNRLRL